MNNITLLLYVYSLGNIIGVRSEQLDKVTSKGVSMVALIAAIISAVCSLIQAVVIIYDHVKEKRATKE